MILASGSGGSWVIAILILIAYKAGKEWWLNNTPDGQAHAARKELAKRAPAGVECPACHEHDVVRVKTGARVASGVAGGLLFSRRARAQFQCVRCGYYF